jgi:putative tricarboxylic transport membrane protein
VTRRRVIATLTVATVMLAAPALAAAPYPTSDINLIIPSGPGPGLDALARLASREAESRLGKRIVIINKPGASWTLGTSDVVLAKPNGYTLGISSNNAVGFQPLVSKVPFGGPVDYQPILKLVDVAVVLAVRADAPWKTLPDFIADARARPGKIRASLPGVLTQADLVLRLFNQAAKVEIGSAPFTGGAGEMLGALLGGHVECSVGNPAVFVAQSRAGKIRYLTVFSKRRLPLLPDVPTTVELGHDVTLPLAYFLMGPRHLDPQIVDRLGKTFTEVMNSPALQAHARDYGYVVDPLGPAELTREINEYRDLYRRIVQDFHIETKR